MELILALILFIGMIASWLMLPGSATTTLAAPPETTERSAPTIRQPA